MKSSSNSELLGHDLNSSTLHLYLKDPTFIEYINAFLLLPAFSNQLFYNKDTEYFEVVNSDGNVGWKDEGLTPSSSYSTLYLPRETIGPPLEKEQSWQWVIEYRLPLFLRSDLFSEYKICKHLTSPPSKSKAKDHLTFENTTDFPTLGQGDTKHFAVSHFISDMQLELPPVFKSGRKVKWHKSISVDPEILTLQHQDSSNNLDRSKSADAIESVCGKCMSDDDIQLLSTKSGMSAFWKFLRGKAGEKNWLFWLDAERVKYYTKEVDQMRLIRELRERYFYSGSPVELPTESRIKMKMNRTNTLTLKQVEELQKIMITGLREYWCPCFLLHHYNKLEKSIFFPSQRHSADTRSYSTTPVALQGPTDSSYGPFTPSRTPTFKKVPSAPKRHPKKHIQQIKHKEALNDPPINTLAVKKAHAPGRLSPSSKFSFDQALRNIFSADEFKTSITSESVMVDEPRESVKYAMTRKIWSKYRIPKKTNQKPDADAGDSESVAESPETTGRELTLNEKPTPNPAQNGLAHETTPNHNLELHATRCSKLHGLHHLADPKYGIHHLPDPNSRCASRMDSEELEGSDQESLCKSRCRILSVSGTPIHSPLHSVASSASLQSLDVVDNRALFKPLLHCLGMEYRKAGGYFMHYLETLEDKVYINCLLFWREVQEYKALFVQASFSPCAVEMKAKALFGKYISEASNGNTIECPTSIVDTVSSNLWPAYEDLFDQAEEHALIFLLKQWIELCFSEDETFQKLATISTSIAVSDSSSSDIFCIEEELAGPSDVSSKPTAHDSIARCIASISMPSSHENTSSSNESTRSITLQNIMEDPDEFEHFKVFLNEAYAAEDLMCWMDIEAYRGISAKEDSMREYKARQLRKKYLNKQYYFGPNSPASKEAQRLTVEAGGHGSRLSAVPSPAVFREMQKHIRARLEKKWVVQFIETPKFLERHSNNTSEIQRIMPSRPTTALKSYTPSYEKSFINSHEAILFRKFLQQPKSCHYLARYLETKDTMTGGASSVHYPNKDINFWTEVQKYKEMYHAHTSPNTLKCKVSAVIDCFMKSYGSRIQLDVPISLIEQVYKKQPGPYLFRELQSAVFKSLCNGWKDYSNFVRGMSERDITRALDLLEREANDIKKARKMKQEMEKSEEERRRLQTPRFETLEEKERRLRQEREESQLIYVPIRFSLTNPNSSFTYFTEISQDSKVKRSGLKITDINFGQQRSKKKSRNQSTECSQKSKSLSSEEQSKEKPEIKISDKTLEEPRRYKAKIGPMMPMAMKYEGDLKPPQSHVQVRIPFLKPPPSPPHPVPPSTASITVKDNKKILSRSSWKQPSTTPQRESILSPRPRQQSSKQISTQKDNVLGQSPDQQSTRQKSATPQRDNKISSSNPQQQSSRQISAKKENKISSQDQSTRQKSATLQRDSKILSRQISAQKDKISSQSPQHQSTKQKPATPHKISSPNPQQQSSKQISAQNDNKTSSQNPQQQFSRQTSAQKDNTMSSQSPQHQSSKQKSAIPQRGKTPNPFSRQISAQKDKGSSPQHQSTKQKSSTPQRGSKISSPNPQQQSSRQIPTSQKMSQLSKQMSQKSTKTLNIPPNTQSYSFSGKDFKEKPKSYLHVTYSS